MPEIDRSSSVTPTQQVLGWLRELINSGQLAPGAAIPSLLTIQQECGVSLPTARKARQALVTEGLAEYRDGLGTFVTKRGTE